MNKKGKRYKGNVEDIHEGDYGTESVRLYDIALWCMTNKLSLEVV